MCRLNELVRQYFDLGNTDKTILEYLKMKHHIVISERTLRRVLRQLGLRRNGVGVPITDQHLHREVQDVQQNSGNRAGYRRTWWLINYNRRMRVTQATVRRYLTQLNPNAVQDRRGRVLIRRRYSCVGPNFLWHADGYDKLKPFGFAIHGAIDGFSRRLMWLQCSMSNNDPKIVLHYYLNAVRDTGGCPRFLRTDNGTETIKMAAAQCCFQGSTGGHFFGPSYRNQRIECWWSVLRQRWSETWIRMFDTLMEFGTYDPGISFHKGIAQFCFMHALRHDLELFMTWWNNHHIRKSSDCPGGKPQVLYDLSEARGFTNYIRCVPREGVTALMDESRIPAYFPQDAERHCQALIARNGWRLPITREDALDLFLRIMHATNDISP